jgi:hypothetical protein
MSEAPHIAAHKHCRSHRPQIEASETCGCFYCLAIFPPAEIEEWLAEPPHLGGETAFCPRCSIDSVIGSTAGYPITREFLQQMNAHWF